MTSRNVDFMCLVALYGSNVKLAFSHSASAFWNFFVRKMTLKEVQS